MGRPIGGRHGRWLAGALTALALSGCSAHREAAATADSSPSVSTTTSAPVIDGPVTSPPTTAMLVTTTTSASTTTSPTATTSPPTRPRPVVVIDPGHNGANGRHTAEIARPVDAGGFRKACNTTGTQGGDLTEAAFNWELAQALRDALAAHDVDVVLTRSDNAGWGPCVDERGQTAARLGADLLISLHADGAAPTGSGFHVIHPSPLPGYVDGVTAARSTTAATAVRDALVANGFAPSNYVGRDGLVERADLGTLNRAGGPAVMVESGNMKRPADLAQLADPAARTRMATALASAVTSFLAVQT